MWSVLVRRPGRRLAAGLVTHLPRRPVDVELAGRQWRSYVDAIAAHGWRIIEVAPADDCPDAVFVEDPVVVYRDVAVLGRSGAPSRRAETAGVAAAVRAAGYRLARIEAPGTLDGGDVLKIGATVYVGRGGRTNDEGIRQLAGHLPDTTVVPVPASRVLHLKSAVTALPDGTLIGYPPRVDDLSKFELSNSRSLEVRAFLAVPEASGAHVVLLGGEAVLMAASAPETARMFAGMGLSPVVVDISEFEKLEGCVTCLSVRLRDR